MRVSALTEFPDDLWSVLGADPAAVAPTPFVVRETSEDDAGTTDRRGRGQRGGKGGQRESLHVVAHARVIRRQRRWSCCCTHGEVGQCAEICCAGASVALG